MMLNTKLRTVTGSVFTKINYRCQILCRNSSTNKWKLQDEDYDRFLNRIALNRKPSLVREMTDLYTQATPNTIFFAGGFPNPSLFPFKDAEFSFENGSKLHLSPELMEDAQQYGSTQGYPPLVKRLTEMTVHYHNPPDMEKRLVAVTAGSQDGFSRALEMMLSPRDYIIVENPFFCGAVSVMTPYKPKFIGIESDRYGMIPERLQEALAKWTPEEVRTQLQGVPKVMYINPSAANPTGMSITVERKKKIYEIARNYNLIILEDDPYYFIQFDCERRTYPPSFLSIDTDGRVIRFDSFSKIISGGFRIGFVTGPSPLVEKLVQHSMITILHAPSLSQVVVNELLKLWDYEGFENQLAKVRRFYLRRRHVMVAAAEKYLKGLCEWNVPTGGMFLWIKVLPLKDTTEMALQRALSRKELIVMPGSAFMTDETAPCPYLRISFSLASSENIHEGLRRLAELIREEEKR